MRITPGQARFDVAAAAVKLSRESVRTIRTTVDARKTLDLAQHKISGSLKLAISNVGTHRQGCTYSLFDDLASRVRRVRVGQEAAELLTAD
jgi:hypothetical protein